MQAKQVASARELYQRFVDSQTAIAEYLDLLELRLQVGRARVTSALSALERHSLLQEDWRAVWRGPDALTPDELRDLAPRLHGIAPQVQAAHDHASRAVEEMTAEGPPSGRDFVDVRSLEGECVQYFIDVLDCRDPENVPESMLNELAQQLEQNNAQYADEPDFEPVDPEAVIAVALPWAQYVLRQRDCEHLSEAMAVIDEIRLLAEVARPTGLLNARKQAFILLVASLDATVFDLLREAIRRDFFRLIAMLAGSEKIAYRELEDIQSWDDFQDQAIDQQLRRRYLKDILNVLHSEGLVALVDEGVADEFGHLLEVVQRRNCHMHSSGAVDAHYLTEANMYGLALGDPLPIDAQYWDRANRMCEFAVRQIAEWVTSLANDGEEAPNGDDQQP